MKPNETWWVIDSTKIKEFCECPRKYFYHFILGWIPELKSVDLSYGTAIHVGLEVLMREGYSKTSVEKAVEAFKTSLLSELGEERVLTLEGGKTIEKGADGLVEYAAQYIETDKEFETIHTEVAGSVPVIEPYSIHFKIDAIVRDKSDGIWVIEHKTSKRESSNLVNQWTLSTQIGAYTHVINSLFPEANVKGLVVNVLVFRSKDRGFQRIRVVKPEKMMDVWLVNTHYWMSQIHHEHSVLEHELKEGTEIMTSFPLCPNACSNWFGCSYFDYCTVWENPLRKCDEVPIGLKQEFWDPRKMEENARKVVKLKDK